MEILCLLMDIWRNYGSKMTEIGTAPLFMDGLWRIIWHTKAIVKTYPTHFSACQMDQNSACYSQFTSLVTHVTPVTFAAHVQTQVTCSALYMYKIGHV